tara:strand:+ start:462 stop:1550 length:1089 start_codon:yes stop_codon:yes gene_type:complete
MSFKNLEPEDILISAFEVHKTFTVTNVDSGSGVYSIPIIKGSDSNLYGWNTDDSDSKTISSSVFYKVPNYYTINSLYYRDITQMAGDIDYIVGVPTASEAVIEYTKTRHLYDTVDNSFTMKLRRPYTRQLHDTATVISVPQELYGESISRDSIRLTDDSTASTIILQDDGYGNLYDIAFSSSYSRRSPDSNRSGSVVGNVFYDDGLIVITDTGSYSTVGTGEASDGFSLKFDSTQTIHEREYVCKVSENEFQHTNNRSLKSGQSSSVAFFGNKYTDDIYKNSIYDSYPYDLTGFSTSSYKNEQYEIGTELIGEATHSEFATYVTTIGLYNNSNELVAIGKTAKPIKNDKEMALTFVVRFDTN